MKKAGSSSSKSKTRRTSRNSTPEAQVTALAQALSVGHEPPHKLAPQDEALFRAFQSNLLSLISHELRTPLTGILNALGLLEEGGGAAGEFSEQELITMARQNAQRLHRALASLLDLASLDSGTFHARLREVDLARLVGTRVEAHRSLLKDRGLAIGTEGASAVPVLADPQKLGRAVDLCLQVAIPRAEVDSSIQLRISSSCLSLAFELGDGNERLWEAAWLQALAGYQGGVASPTSAFGGVLQSEQAFLTRLEEGLGSEFMLVHEIMRIHHGSFEEARQGRSVTLMLKLPELSSEEGLRAVLASRAYEVSTELASVALVLVQVPENTRTERFCEKVRKSLFRASDAVYALPTRKQVALVLDDCKPEDAPRLMGRVTKSVGQAISYGAAHCPGDGLDPTQLLGLAERRLAAALSGGDGAEA